MNSIIADISNHCGSKKFLEHIIQANNWCRYGENSNL